MTDRTGDYNELVKLVTKLRKMARYANGGNGDELAEDAADAIESLIAERTRLRAIVEKVSEADDVAKAYQQVYFEDERRWQLERDGRIKAEAKVGELQSILIDNTHALRTVLHGSSGAMACSPKEAWERTLAEVAAALTCLETPDD